MFDFMFANSKTISLTVLILCYVTIPAFSYRPSTDYCKVNCTKGTHTVCTRKNDCGPVEACVVIESDTNFRTHMVKVHNEFRNKIASGEIPGPYENKGATNMNAVSYDLEVEYIAACWANTCFKLDHDDCRNSQRFLIGQNIWWGMDYNETEFAVRDWFSEINDFTDSKWIEEFSSYNYPTDGKMRGHFTQVIWADTKYIGCARVRFGQKSRETQLICNYGPAGNVMGAPIYKMATDASQIASDCEEGKNTEYTSLCGTIKPVKLEKSASRTCRMISAPLSIYFCICVVFGLYFL